MSLLALVQHWGRKIPRRQLLVARGIAVAIMGIYEGAASWVQHALMVAGVIDIPAGLGRRSAYWHLVFWDPWWLVGGLLFGLATRHMFHGGVGRCRGDEAGSGVIAHPCPCACLRKLLPLSTA